jgi:hypothetical protein
VDAAVELGAELGGPGVDMGVGGVGARVEEGFEDGPDDGGLGKAICRWCRWRG